MQSEGSEPQIVVNSISADTPFLDDAVVPEFKLSKGLRQPTVCRFRMVAAGRAEFGEVIRVTLRPM